MEGPTFMLRQVDGVLVSAAAETDRAAVLSGIAKAVTFKISAENTVLFYAIDIEQTAKYIKVYCRSYITSCLTKLGWEATRQDCCVVVPIAPSTLKAMSNSPGPLNPKDLLVITERFGFQYRTLTGMLIFAVQIGRFDIAPAVSILCKYNDRPAEVHFLAAKTMMRYLRSTINRGLIYWRPTGRERSDLPHGDLTPFHPESDIAPLFQAYLPLLEPVCFVDASYGGLLVIGEHRSITGIVIMLGGTAILVKTRIQSTTALSSTKAETMAGCDAGKIIKYMRKLFTDLRLVLKAHTRWRG
jgi:hypothetical protein